MECNLRIPLDLGRDRRAATFVEYAVIAGVIAATVLVGFSSLAGTLSAYFVTLSASL